jgi:hypothetical protein
MYSELERTAIEDPDDNRRFRTLMTEGNASAAAGSKPPAVPPPSASSAGSSRGSSRSRVEQGQKQRKGAGVEDAREHEVNEAILKQLHKKNQALQAEVARLTKALEQSKPSSSGVDSSAPVKGNSQLQELENLRAQLKQQQAGEKKSLSAASITAEMDRLELLQLRKQYQDLLGIKIEILERGESTGKVNKEVKDFFVATKAKLVSDVVARETERALWNERVYQLEVELASMERK